VSGGPNSGLVYRDRVRKEGAGETVLQHHVRRFRHSDEAGWRARIDAGRVRVNGEAAAADRVLAEGDRLEYFREGWTEPAAPAGARTVYEDDHLMVVDKPAGLQVVPGGLFLERTLLHVIRGSGVRGGERDGQRDDEDRSLWSPVHRIGRGTSGLVLIGKSAVARKRLSAAFRRRRLGKIYLAWAQSSDLPASFAVREPIAPVQRSPARIHSVVAGGKPSLTLVRVLRRDPARGASLVAAWPVTGRADQIRIHLWWAGAPLVGEPLYGAGRTLLPARPGDVGYHLHATSLRFRHPVTRLRMRVRADPPWPLDRAPCGPVVVSG
jgi:23S rRNA pseudouridine1911/1915/1917 synthase